MKDRNSIIELDYHEFHSNLSTAYLRAGTQIKRFDGNRTDYKSPHAGGMFGGMICEYEGNGDCNIKGHRVDYPDLDGSLILQQKIRVENLDDYQADYNLRGKYHHYDIHSSGLQPQRDQC